MSLGIVTKQPSIRGDAGIWKAEGVGPNPLSDCGFRVTQARAASGSVLTLRPAQP